MDVMEGSNITLPCNVERPYINIYTAEWKKDSETVSFGQFDDLDLKLTNVSRTHRGEYICRVQSSINEPVDGADATARTITLNVLHMHSKITLYTYRTLQGILHVQHEAKPCI